MDISEAANFDNFFYYSKNDLSYENECDVYLTALQPKAKLFYNRQYGGGIDEFLNFPVGFMMSFGIKYNVALALANRNGTTTDGTNNQPDRRIYVSQNSIDVNNDNAGNVSVNIAYYDAFNFKVIKKINIPVGIKI